MEYVSGKSITGEIHPLLLIFHLTSTMKYSHLPWPGSLADQHPEIIDTFLYIWAEQNAYDKQQEQLKKRNPPSTSRPSSRRYR